MSSSARMAQGFIVLSLNDNDSTFSSKLILSKEKEGATFYFIKAIKISPYVDITQHNGLSFLKSQRGRTANEVKSTKLKVTVKNICRAVLSD